MAKKLIAKVTSIYDLRLKAETDVRYAALAKAAAENLGYHKGCAAGKTDLEKYISWLNINANETSEQGVVGEINFVRDCVDEDDIKAMRKA